jgi:hypothetical protein
LGVGLAGPQSSLLLLLLLLLLQVPLTSAMLMC